MASFPLTRRRLDFDTIARVIEEKQTLELDEALLDQFQALPAELPAGAREISRAYLESQVVTFGAETEEKILRLALFFLLQVQVRQAGQGPVQRSTVQRLLAFYNREVFPVVLQAGSDTARLAQLCQPLLLSGKVRFQGYPLKAAEVAEMFSWPALALAPAEVQALVAAPVLTWAQGANLLMHLRPLINWFIYFDAVFSRVLPDSNAALHRSLKDLIRHLEATQQALEQAIAGEAQQVPLEVTLQQLAQALPLVLQQLSDLDQVLLGGLETMVEPPATTTFALAIEMSQLLVLSQPNTMGTAGHSFTAFQALENITTLLPRAQTLASLVFWSFIQADAISGDFLESSTLQVYQQAGLFVPEETVNDQLEKIAVFIQTHIPVGTA